MGNEKARKKLIRDISEKPLKLNGEELSLVVSDKYLGDQISVNCAESAAATVKKRLGLVSHSVFQIKAVVEDARAEVVGGLTVGLAIWEITIIPMLLHNSETWTDMRKKTVKQLDKIQLKYLRLLLGVGKGYPIPVLLYHRGTLSM